MPGVYGNTYGENRGGYFGVGASLASLGASEKHEAIQGLAHAAEEESKRNIQNEQLDQQEKAGKVQLGSTLGAAGGFALGAQSGSIGGPLGMLIGGAVGAIAGGLFS